MNLYGLRNRNAIDSNPIMTASEKGTLDFMFNHADLKYITCATVCGYMNAGMSTVHKYNGRYGKGYVRTTPQYYNGKLSTKYMVIEYWVEK